MKSHIVCVGNPGVGKSTILNALMREVAFKSCFSIGEGIATLWQTHETNNFTYIDTPGLEGLKRREATGKKISKAIKGGDKIKLVFIYTLEGGRVRPSGLKKFVLLWKQLIKLESTKRKNILYSLISAAKRKITECKTSREREQIRLVFSECNLVSHMELFPLVFPALDQDNTFASIRSCR